MDRLHKKELVACSCNLSHSPNLVKACRLRFSSFLKLNQERSKCLFFELCKKCSACLTCSHFLVVAKYYTVRCVVMWSRTDILWLCLIYSLLLSSKQCLTVLLCWYTRSGELFRCHEPLDPLVLTICICSAYDGRQQNPSHVWELQSTFTLL